MLHYVAVCLCSCSWRAALLAACACTAYPRKPSHHDFNRYVLKLCFLSALSTSVCNPDQLQGPSARRAYIYIYMTTFAKITPQWQMHVFSAQAMLHNSDSDSWVPACPCQVEQCHTFCKCAMRLSMHVELLHSCKRRCCGCNAR